MLELTHRLRVWIKVLLRSLEVAEQPHCRQHELVGAHAVLWKGLMKPLKGQLVP